MSENPKSSLREKLSNPAVLAASIAAIAAIVVALIGQPSTDSDPSAASTTTITALPPGEVIDPRPTPPDAIPFGSVLTPNPLASGFEALPSMLVQGELSVGEHWMLVLDVEEDIVYRHHVKPICAQSILDLNPGMEVTEDAPWGVLDSYIDLSNERGISLDWC